MKLLPTEDQLKNYLRRVEEIDDLPLWAELEPGSFIYAVKEVWEKEQDRDGRRGHLSEAGIASIISKYTGRKFSRNQYQAMFGAGRKDQKSRQEIPRDIAEAFLRTAFENWSFAHAASEDKDNGENGHIFQDRTIDYRLLASQIAELMYSPGKAVKCLPIPGWGPKGFYRQCRKSNKSVIIATEREHIVMNDPESGLADWIENIRILFKYSEDQKSTLMHIWAIKEPLISDDPRSISSLYDIGLLRTAFMVARALCLSRTEFPDWSDLSGRCVIAILLNSSNDKFRKEIQSQVTNRDPPIQEYFIFPKEVPWQWRSRDGENLSLSDINFITTVDDSNLDDILIGYNIFLHKENSGIPPVVEKNSPSTDSNRNFLNLYLACKQYVEQQEKDELKQLLESAQNHGWHFMTADEFLDLRVP